MFFNHDVYGFLDSDGSTAVYSVPPQRKAQSNPLTFRSGRSLWTTSTRSFWYLMTSSRFLYACGASSRTAATVSQATPVMALSNSSCDIVFLAAVLLNRLPAP
eukprot:GHVS01048190.1.p2 GENE.GHVS01048190.1~~GHVS01048190.1.p2  ORF type:complete len:103 (+),score=1.26 GHVS01048190.1:239-547(+)